MPDSDIQKVSNVLIVLTDNVAPFLSSIPNALCVRNVRQLHPSLCQKETAKMDDVIPLRTYFLKFA